MDYRGPGIRREETCKCPQLLQGGTLFLLESARRDRGLLTVMSQSSAHSQIVTPAPISTWESLVVSLEVRASSLSPSPSHKDLTWLRLPILHPKGVPLGMEAQRELTRIWVQLLIPRPLICGDTWVWSL